MKDAIFIRGIEFEAAHGYTAAERKVTRRFRCDIELRSSLDAASRSDRIKDTIDYRKVCALVMELGTTRTFRLLEALAGAIADALAAQHSQGDIVVTVEKINPPCPGNPGATGVRLVRASSDAHKMPSP